MFDVLSDSFALLKSDAGSSFVGVKAFYKAGIWHNHNSTHPHFCQGKRMKDVDRESGKERLILNYSLESSKDSESSES